MSPEQTLGMFWKYLMLLAYTNDHCLNPMLSDNDPAKPGCTEITKGASSWKALLSEYASILPTPPQLATLHGTLTHFKANESEAVIVQRLVRSFVAEEELRFGFLSSDKRPENIFSVRSKEDLQNWLKRAPKDRATPVMQLRYIFSTLTETRLARLELVQSFHDFKYLLAAIIAPQTVVLIIILYHLVVLKRRERKVKRQLEQSNRDQALLARLQERRARRDQS